MKKKLQVFVSSTYTDLKDERQAAVAAILKAGHIPAGMELFTSGDKSQMKTIERWIDESDVYMLILGGRYGSIEKATGISYTELEYDYAREQGKAMFSVVINAEALDGKVRTHGATHLERENPKELALFREKVLTNISSFFSDDKDVRLCVHESLAEFVESRDLKGWVSAEALDDSRSLQDEVRRLREENSSLKEALASSERTRSAIDVKNRPVENFDEIKAILASIQIKVPEEITADKKEIARDLLFIFQRNQDYLLTGVTNASSADAVESFFYHNVCPKLQVHGLADNEKVVGVRYRRSFVTKLGAAFLSHLDREALSRKDASSATEALCLPEDQKRE